MFPLLLVFAVDHAAANPPAEVLAREKAAAVKLRELGLEVVYGNGKLAGHVVRVAFKTRPGGTGKDTRQMLSPKDLAPFRDLPWVQEVFLNVTDLDAEAAWNLSGPRRLSAGILCVSGIQDRAVLTVHPGALAELKRLNPNLSRLAVEQALLPEEPVTELLGYKGLKQLVLCGTVLSDKQALLVLDRRYFPVLGRCSLRTKDPGVAGKIAQELHERRYQEERKRQREGR